MIPGPAGSLTKGAETLVCDWGSNTEDILLREEKRWEAANFGRFLVKRFVTKAVLRSAIENTPYNKYATVRLNLLNSYSKYLQCFEDIKSGEVHLLNELYPRSEPPKADGGALTFLSPRSRCLYSFFAEGVGGSRRKRSPRTPSRSSGRSAAVVAAAAVVVVVVVVVVVGGGIVG